MRNGKEQCVSGKKEIYKRMDPIIVTDFTFGSDGRGYKFCIEMSSVAYEQMPRPNIETGKCPGDTVPCFKTEEGVSVCSQTGDGTDCPINDFKVFTPSTFNLLTDDWLPVLTYHE